jgi:hypothetical protein
MCVRVRVCVCACVRVASCSTLKWSESVGSSPANGHGCGLPDIRHTPIVPIDSDDLAAGA